MNHKDDGTLTEYQLYYFGFDDAERVTLYTVDNSKITMREVVDKTVEFYKEFAQRQATEATKNLYTEKEVIEMAGDCANCSTCSRLISPTNERFCEACDNMMHDGCEGLVLNAGSYEDEKGFCKSCTAKHDSELKENK